MIHHQPYVYVYKELKDGVWTLTITVEDTTFIEHEDRDDELKVAHIHTFECTSTEEPQIEGKDFT